MIRMKGISLREKRLIGAAAAAVVLFVVIKFLVFPSWDQWMETAGNIDSHAKRVTNYRKILGGQDTVKAALEAARQQTSAEEAGLLASPTDALANAELQGMAKGLATSKGLACSRSDSLPVKNITPEYGKVQTRLELMGSIDQLVSFLAALEPAPKILVLEEMRIVSIGRGSTPKKQIMATVVVSAMKKAEVQPVIPSAKS